MKKFKYTLDSNGFIIGCGYLEILQHELKGDEPFEGFGIVNWRLNPDTNQWESLLIDYKYIIIPCEKLPELNAMVDLVEDVHYEQFDVNLEIQNIITRAGNKIEIPNKTIKFFICKLLKWDEGDKEQINAIIDNWNTTNPDRIIDFICTFENENELTEFIQQWN